MGSLIGQPGGLWASDRSGSAGCGVGGSTLIYRQAIQGCFLGILFLSWTLSSHANTGIQTGKKVCPNPAAPCTHDSYTFQSYELSVSLPKELAWMTAYYSSPFYAILLRSVKAIPAADPTDECRGYISEQERLKVQAIFPQRKVFASRNGCFGPGMVWYTNINSKYNFLAVYGGETLEEAQQFLKQVKAKGFHAAKIRKVQLVVDTSH
jgi:hypothetical protein